MRLLGLLALLHLSFGRNDDLFNYDNTVGRDYGPEEWDQVTCDDLTECTGWPDDWLLGEGWGLEQNSCRYCPKGSNKCGRHHQSPIDLERNRAVAGHPDENECIDLHWMKYEDSSCTWKQMEDKNAFSIERHTLKVTQPLDQAGDNGGQRIDCPSDQGRRFGRIDFSKGFSDWWFLSHIDFKVPSEHTQNGKRYSAEVQMAHFYSVTGEVAGVDNEMANVAMFLEAYDDSPPYPFLDRMICEWRKVEDKTRSECGLSSVDPYPGCFNFARGRTPSPSQGATEPPSTSPSPSVHVPTPVVPTQEPTLPPFNIPGAPTNKPTTSPAPSTAAPVPTPAPTTAPTDKPTPFPTNVPTPYPTKEPTELPTTQEPTTSFLSAAPIPETPSPVIVAPSDQPVETTVAPVPAPTTQPVTPTERPTVFVAAPSDQPMVPVEVPAAPVTDSTELPVSPVESPTAPLLTDSTESPIAPVESPTDPPLTESTESLVAPAPTPTGDPAPVSISNEPPFAPVANPTVAPVVPVADPTELPVAPNANPTEPPVAPMQPPTEPPVAAPTESPVAPVDPPTDSPVAALVEAPTGAPAVPSNMPLTEPSPTDSPVAPVDPSTNLPVADPTLPPVAPVEPVRQRSMLRKSVNEMIMDNSEKEDSERERILLGPENFREAQQSDEEWAEWVAAYSAHDRGVASDSQRQLLENDHLSFSNYQFLIDVRTEYYFRYSGTQTVPPCYGPVTTDTRGNTNHWRVMKDPIRVHPRQIAEMERLLKERIAPKDAESKACKNDTAAKVDSGGRVSVARPLMQTHNSHFKTFCECQDWSSKWPEDRQWCKLKNEDQNHRLYDHPYNFYSEGTF